MRSHFSLTAISSKQLQLNVSDRQEQTRKVTMKIGDKVRILANRYVKVDRTGVIARPETAECYSWEDPSGRMETGRWEVVIDEEFHHLNPCILAEGVLCFRPIEMQVIG